MASCHRVHRCHHREHHQMHDTTCPGSITESHRAWLCLAVNVNFPRSQFMGLEPSPSRLSIFSNLVMPPHGLCQHALCCTSSQNLATAVGSGVNVYMIDTGIKFSHQEFGHMDGTSGSRAVPGFSVFGDNNSSDCYGHGTHTAATVGGEYLNRQLTAVESRLLSHSC